MSVTVNERNISRSTTTGTSGSHRRIYDAYGSSDEATVIAAVASVAPASYGGSGSIPYMKLNSISVGPVHIDTINESECRWEAAVTYGATSGGGGDQPGDEPTTSFDTGGGTVHKQFSIATQTYMPATAKVYDKAIGVEMEGGKKSIKGADVVAPAYQWRETAYLNDDTMDETYQHLLMEKTGTINNGDFRGFAEGEVLFMGASGNKRADGIWEITYNFAAKPNVEDWNELSLGAMDIEGWDYVWAEYEDVRTEVPPGSGNFVMKMKPKAVYAEQVYEKTDFAAIVLEDS